MQEGFGSVLDFLEAQRRHRPVSLQEIFKRVTKHERASAREIRGLVLRGQVRVIVIRFSTKDDTGLLRQVVAHNVQEMVLYTLNREVQAFVIKQGTRF